MAQVTNAAGSWRESAKEDLKKTVGELKGEIQEEERDIAGRARVDMALYPPPPRVYWTTVGVYVAVMVLLGFYAWISLTALVIPVGIPVNVGVAILLLQVLYFIDSLQSIGVNDLAGFSLFGRPWHVPKTGIYIVPRGILTLIRADRNYKDERFPGPADKIFRISEEKQRERPGGDMPPEGMVRPIFVTTGEPKLTDEEKKQLKGGGNPLDQQLSVEIAYFVRYRPNQEHGGVFRIARNLSAQTGDIDQRIKDLVREQSERDMKSVLSRLTLATIIENWDLVNEIFILKIRLAVLRLGIDIDKRGGGLDDINPSRETNVAQAEVAREQFRKLATITKADAEREKRIREGEGAGRAEQARLEGLAGGYKKIKDDLGIGGESVIASETAKASLGKTTLVVGTGGVKELFGLVAAGKEFFSSQTPDPNADKQKGA